MTAKTAKAAKPGMKPEDIGALVEAADPRVSPDGATVAFSVTTMDLKANDYRSRIWLVPADGSAKPIPFSAGKKRDGQPRWSPDGRLVAFTSNREEKGGELYVLAVDKGGEPAMLASSPEGIGAIAWSPDGESIAYTTRVRDERYEKDADKDRSPRRVTRLFSRLDSVGWTFDRPIHLFVVPADGSAPPRALTSGEYPAGSFSWSPDSTRIVFSSARHEIWDLDNAVDLFTVEADGDDEQEPVRLTTTGPSYFKPSWSPDGSTIAFLIETDPMISPTHSQVGVIDAGGGEPRLLSTSLDRHCAPYSATAREPVWDGGDVLFQIEDEGAIRVHRVLADGSGKPELVVGGYRMVKGFDLRGGTLAFTATDPTALSELFVADGAADASERRLTSFGRAFASRRTLVAPERFTATSADGTEVEAWIMRPAGAKPGQKYPTILNIHGGPFTQYGWTFFDEFQVQVGAGYAVVFANPRGSSGYSEAWGRAIRGPVADEEPGSGWGGVDYEDLMAVVDEAVQRFDFVDPERVGVQGGSYGGYMTSWIIGHTDRFRAAISERAVNNVLSLEYASDAASAFRTWIGQSHLDSPEEYVRQSPITHVREMTTPVLILHSENDLRCPIEQADQLFVALRLLGRDPEFVRFPGESHELSRSGAPKHRVQRMELILEWFDRKLQR